MIDNSLYKGSIYSCIFKGTSVREYQLPENTHYKGWMWQYGWPTVLRIWTEPNVGPRLTIKLDSP